MQPDQLWVFTARSNPLGYSVPHQNWQKFTKGMLDAGVNFVTIECAYGELDHECEDAGLTPDQMARYHHIGVRAKTRGWIKENLLNLAIHRFPQAQYLAWIDADIIFRNPNWPLATLHALQHYDILQPWAHCLDLGPHGELLQTHTSFCRQFFLKEPLVGKENWKWAGGKYDFPHPGYAWAMTRQAYEWVGGLLECGAMGSGDHHMSLGLIGHADMSLPNAAAGSYRSAVKLWERRARQHIAGNIGYVPGIIEHLFHGKKENRGYETRWEMFIKHGFDPHEDLKRNAHGVFEFALNKPELRHDFDLYMHSRNEDGSL